MRSVPKDDGRTDEVTDGATPPSPEGGASPPPAPPLPRDLTWPILGCVVAITALSTVLVPQAFRAVSDSREGARYSGSNPAPDPSLSTGERARPAAGRAGGERHLSSPADAAAFAAVAGRLEEPVLYEIYTSYVAADRNATADVAAATASGASLPAGFAHGVHERYKEPIRRRFGLTMDELEAIGAHGARNAWPKPR